MANLILYAQNNFVSLRGHYKLKAKREVENIVISNHSNVLFHHCLDFGRSIFVTKYVEKIIEFDGSDECIHNSRKLLDVKIEGISWLL